MSVQFRLREFELSVLSFLYHKPTYFAQRKDHFKKLRFDDPKLQKIFNELDYAYSEYKTFPTKTELTQRIKSRLTENAEYLDLEWDEYEDSINEVYNREVTGITGEELNRFVADEQRKAIADRLASAPVDKLPQIAREVEIELKQFRRLNYQEHDFGLDFFSDEGIDKVVKLVEDYNDAICIPTGWANFDRMFKGGSRKGELNCILGSTGLGKTTCLLNLSRCFLNQGARVVYVYLDSMEEEIATRMSSCWFGECIDEDTDPEQLKARLKEFNKKYRHRLFMKQFPARSVTPADIDQYLTDLKSYLYIVDKEAGVYEEDCGNIDVVVIDYMDVVAYGDARDAGEAGFQIEEQKAQELNAMAVHHKVAVWTGSQGGTEAMKSDKPKIWQAQGYKSRFNPIANVLIICCPEDERLQLRRRFTIEIGKFRRAAEFHTIPFILDIKTQTIYEDETRIARVKSERDDNPEQTEEEATGKPSVAASKDTVVSIIGG